ncbi:MAG: hypothetical protein LJE94_00520 [Deltaproteobacteria bacterium]|nr:hypothetical protein [Deltaproteobacteria bacterium]
MNDSISSSQPRRITDLTELAHKGARVECRPVFEILPVDFHHRDNQFMAYIFLARYVGSVDGEAFTFRKCYAKGCPHNLCMHVSQAVMIANRYLQRDYHRLKAAGIAVGDHLFTLESMVVKYDELQDGGGPIMTIHDYINLAREGNPVSVEVVLEQVSAVEHFAHEDNAQTFLNGNFKISALGGTGSYQRCFSCYPTDSESEEKAHAIHVANARLQLLYEELDQAAIQHTRLFFNQ